MARAVAAKNDFLQANGGLPFQLDGAYNRSKLSKNYRVISAEPLAKVPSKGFLSLVNAVSEQEPSWRVRDEAEAENKNKGWHQLKSKRQSPLQASIEEGAPEREPTCGHVEEDVVEDHNDGQFPSPRASAGFSLEDPAGATCHAWKKKFSTSNHSIPFLPVAYHCQSH
jgi:hypothetical protein